MLLRALAVLSLILPLAAESAGTFPVRRYGTEHGLCSEVVSALVQDHAGQLWVGTEGGLCTFDGRQFNPFNGPLPPGFVQHLFVDLDGAVWVATDGGLARIDHGRSHRLGEAEGIPRGSVEEVARDADGHLWVLTSQGVRVEDASHGFIAPMPWPDPELPAHLFADPSLPGAWAITSRAIWRWRPQGWVKQDPPPCAPGEILLDLSVDGERDLWVRTISTLWHLPAEGPRTWVGLPMAGGYSHISRLSRDARGWVWVDSTAGLWRVRGSHRERFGHAQDDARGGMVDQDGGFWLRTDKGVLRVLGQTHWRTYGPQDGLPQDTTWQMIRDHQGHLWVATDKGLWVEAGGKFKRTVPGRFLVLALGKDDTLWAAGSPGGTVQVMDTRTLKGRSIRIEKLPVARITAALTIDAEGHPWLANDQGGVVRGTRAGSGWSWESMPIGGLPPRGVKGLLALPGGGVLLLHDQSASTWKAGQWKRLPDLLTDLPFTAAARPDGKVVIAYKDSGALTVHALKDGGLVRTAVLNLAPPGTNMVFYSVALGTDDRIWIGTAHGLGYVDGDHPETFRILGTEDRLVSPECDQGAIFAEPGRIWIGTPSGLMSHDPRPSPPRQELRAPLILSAQAGGKELEGLDQIPELTRKHNELELRFMVPNYQVQDTLTYAAKLSDVDADWIKLDTPHLRYAGLQAGPHVLELRGLTPHGVLGPVTTFRFRVRPEWWERWWVRGLGLLGLAGLIVLLVKVRQARLEQRNRELMEEVARQTSAPLAASRAKSAFLANMSHELRTPLNAILLYSEILQEDMKDPALGELRQDARKIQSAGRHLLGLIDDILDLSKIEAGRLRLELQDIELHAFMHDLDATIRPLVEKNGNRFEIDIHEAAGRICSDPVRLRQILTNLLGNSAKFTDKGYVLLKAWPEAEDLVVVVQDNGIGMTLEQQAKVFREFEQADDSTTRKFGGTGLGLTLVQKFMGLLGGELALESMPGQGTTFTLRFPKAGPSQDLQVQED
ncbi:hypothetical protein GETHLI_31640 [Geothrix limicola]|uniref:histidine kinase n=1 Tax=Geothrix limicola TaxID=2927978 RepID=A0ABQ5QII0_9BACT|nr:ATP-binding protein [Geothrix limicola]GLH74662.1 hypothetical protein GETHLI_31640 [Geothrix limicola]